jgi:hypothetical protein
MDVGRQTAVWVEANERDEQTKRPLTSLNSLIG